MKQSRLGTYGQRLVNGVEWRFLSDDREDIPVASQRHHPATRSAPRRRMRQSNLPAFALPHHHQHLPSRSVPPAATRPSPGAPPGTPKRVRELEAEAARHVEAASADVDRAAADSAEAAAEAAAAAASSAEGLKPTHAPPEAPPIDAMMPVRPMSPAIVWRPSALVRAATTQAGVVSAPPDDGGSVRKSPLPARATGAPAARRLPRACAELLAKRAARGLPAGPLSRVDADTGRQSVTTYGAWYMRPDAWGKEVRRLETMARGQHARAVLELRERREANLRDQLPRLHISHMFREYIQRTDPAGKKPMPAFLSAVPDAAAHRPGAPDRASSKASRATTRPGGPERAVSTLTTASSPPPSRRSSSPAFARPSSPAKIVAAGGSAPGDDSGILRTSVLGRGRVRR